MIYMLFKLNSTVFVLSRPWVPTAHEGPLEVYDLLVFIRVPAACPQSTLLLFGFGPAPGPTEFNAHRWMKDNPSPMIIIYGVTPWGWSHHRFFDLAESLRISACVR